MKLKRFLSIGLCLAMLATLLTVPALAADTAKTLTLREDWRLTSDLDLAVPEGTTLTINGNGHYIYELGGTLQNSGLGTVTFTNGTILYPAGNSTSCTTETSNALMAERQPHIVTVGSMSNGTVTATSSGTSNSGAATAKKDETVTMTVTPDSGYELDTLTVKDANDGNLSVTNKTFVMPASNVTVTATFKQSNTPSETTYAVTVHGSHADSTGAGNYAAGASVAINAGSQSGYTFAGWTSSDVTISDASNANASFTMPAKAVSVTANWTQNSTPGDSGSSSSGSSSSGSSSSSSTTTKNPDGSTTTTTTNKTTGTVTETTKNTDGSTTTVETKKDGTVTETNKTADGTTGTVVTDKNGDVTEVKATVSTKAATEAAKSGETVTLPVEVPAVKSTETAPAVNVTVPKSTGSVKVEIPVEKVTRGTVAVIVKADGTEEIVKTSIPTEGGVALTLEASATVKIIDNSKVFIDVHGVDHWAQDSIDFVTSRELFTGKTETRFDPNAHTTRAQLMTVLARLDNADTSAAPLQRGMEWAVERGISDGSNPGGNISRQQLAVMLWRYADSPTSNYALSHPDAGSVSGYAQAAMQWAVENGIMNGDVNGNLNPQSAASRAHVAAMVARFCATLA